MAGEDVVLMKGNEAIARAAINYGVDAYFGYPITPQSEVLYKYILEYESRIAFRKFPQ